MRVRLAVAPMIIVLTLSTISRSKRKEKILYRLVACASAFSCAYADIIVCPLSGEKCTHVYCGMSGPLSWRTRLGKKRREEKSSDFPSENSPTLLYLFSHKHTHTHTIIVMSDL